MRKALSLLAVTCLIVTCGVCSLLGAKLAMQPNEPLIVSAGEYIVWVYKSPQVTANAAGQVIVFSNRTGAFQWGTGPCVRKRVFDATVGDYDVMVWGCQR